MVSGKGFIVHPFETSDGRSYDAVAPGQKRPTKFRTLSAAKEYLRKKGVKESDYDSPSGIKTIHHHKPAKTRRKPTSSTSLFGSSLSSSFGGSSFGGFGSGGKMESAFSGFGSSGKKKKRNMFDF